MQKVNCPLCHSSNSVNITKIFNQIAQSNFCLEQCECNFVFLNPRPELEDLKNYYIDNNYHPHAKGKGFLFLFYKIAKKITYYWKFKVIKKNSNQDILHLDYGAGDGSFSNYLNSKKNVESISYDPYYPNSTLTEVVEKKYNVITLWHVLEHIYDLDSFWIEIKKMLDKNGRIFIAVPNFDSMEKKYFGKDWAAYDIPRHLYHFNADSLDRLLDQKGFKVLSKKRMLLDTLYISILSSKHKSVFQFSKAISIAIMVISKVLFKGANYSSSLFYVCERKK